MEGLDQVGSELGDDPAADRDLLVALLGGKVLVARGVDLADDRDADLPLLGHAAGDLGDVLRVDQLRARLDGHPDEHDVGAEGHRLGGRDHRHAPTLAVPPLGRVLGPPVETHHERRGAAVLEDRPKMRDHARAQENRVRPTQPIDDRREVLESGTRSVVEAVVDRHDDHVLPAVEEPLEPDRLARRHR